MDTETTLLALLESQEAEANARAEWVAEWVEAQRKPMLDGFLSTDVATLLAEVGEEQALQLNHAAWLLMTGGDKKPMQQLIGELMDAELAALASVAWGEHVAELQDAMSAEQFEQYQINQHRSAA